MRTLCVLLSIVSVFGGDQVTYHGHQVIRAIVDTREQGELLMQLSSQYDFWSEVGIGRFGPLNSCLNNISLLF